MYKTANHKHLYVVPLTMFLNDLFADECAASGLSCSVEHTHGYSTNRRESLCVIQSKMVSVSSIVNSFRCNLLYMYTGICVHTFLRTPQSGS